MLCSGEVSGKDASLNEHSGLLLKWGLRPRLWITFCLAFNRSDQWPIKAEALRLLAFEAVGEKSKKPVISGT